MNHIESWFEKIKALKVPSDNFGLDDPDSCLIVHKDVVNHREVSRQ